MSHASIKGIVRVEIIDHLGAVVHSRDWQRNLVLDQGLNNLADVLICDLFRVAVKGNDTEVMKETVTGTYTLNSGLARVTRVSGARAFTAGDVGKLIYTSASGGKQAIIVAADAGGTFVDVRAVGTDDLAAQVFTAQSIIIYAVQKVGIGSEDSRTSTYSSIAGENSTTTSGGVRTVKRTFLFDPEPENSEEPANTNTYTWSGTGVTRTAGTRDFTTDDVGKYIEFPSTGQFCKIASRTSATVVVVDRAPVGAHANLNIKLYGFNSYSHIAFSDQDDAGDNCNIMVRLETGGVASPVKPLGENPETPGQQVKVTYQMQMTFGPLTSVAFSGGLFNDPDNAMGTSGKGGSMVLETLASSYIDEDGDTVSAGTGLEPADPGSVALSTNTAALVPLTNTSNPPDRSSGAVSVAMDSDDYVADSFTRTYTGVFDINTGNGNTWRTMGIFDADNAEFLFTMRWDNVQKKPATHQLGVHFRKTWDRDLS